MVGLEINFWFFVEDSLFAWWVPWLYPARVSQPEAAARGICSRPLCLPHAAAPTLPVNSLHTETVSACWEWRRWQQDCLWKSTSARHNTALLKKGFCNLETFYQSVFDPANFRFSSLKPIPKACWCFSRCKSNINCLSVSAFSCIIVTAALCAFSWICMSSKCRFRILSSVSWAKTKTHSKLSFLWMYFFLTQSGFEMCNTEREQKVYQTHRQQKLAGEINLRQESVHFLRQDAAVYLHSTVAEKQLPFCVPPLKETFAVAACDFHSLLQRGFHLFCQCEPASLIHFSFSATISAHKDRNVTLGVVFGHDRDYCKETPMKLTTAWP